MSRNVLHHDERRPGRRVAAGVSEAIFFPGEVARLLQLDRVEYDQLRRMYLIVRTARGEETHPRKWARYTLRDIAALEVLIDLGGSRDAFNPGRRLVLDDVERACSSLRDLGVADPLLEVDLARHGRRILARIGEYVFEPTSGQMALATAHDYVDQFLRERRIKDAKVRDAIRKERSNLRRRTVLRLRAPAEADTELVLTHGA